VDKVGTDVRIKGVIHVHVVRRGETISGSIKDSKVNGVTVSRAERWDIHMSGLRGKLERWQMR
jgi:hypothetical protein